jgi:hypothetical protein
LAVSGVFLAVVDVPLDLSAPPDGGWSDLAAGLACCSMVKGKEAAGVRGLLTCSTASSSPKFLTRGILLYISNKPVKKRETVRL